MGHSGDRGGDCRKRGSHLQSNAAALHHQGHLLPLSVLVVLVHHTVHPEKPQDVNQKVRKLGAKEKEENALCAKGL